MAASGTLNASDFVPLPLHPANLKHVLDDFAALIADRLLILPEEDAITLAAAAAAGPPPSSPPSSPPPAMLISAPLMSCRTLLPLASSAEGPDKRSGTEMEPREQQMAEQVEEVQVEEGWERSLRWRPI